MSSDFTCRNCGALESDLVIDLGLQPSANGLLSEQELAQINAGVDEPRAPLVVHKCRHCHLVQLTHAAGPEKLFHSDYVYYSSISKSWMAHAKQYVDMIVDRLRLGPDSFAVEIASNDGYLLRNMVARGVPCLGIDPAEKTAAAAASHGVETRVTFFNVETAQQVAAERGQADLILGNNVLAHVPDINAFVAGLPILLKPGGTVTFEFPHLAQLIQQTQFDTIYDEHYSYLSLAAVREIMAQHGLWVYDVERLPTHGGSLRVFITQETLDQTAPSAAVLDVLAEEETLKLNTPSTYNSFRDRALAIRAEFRAAIAEEIARGGKVAAFGAAAKGNTFLNYCAVGRDQIDFVVDDTPAKQGRFLPGSFIPIVAFEALLREQPDLVVMLPWNVAADIKKRLAPMKSWHGRVLTAIPELKIEAL